MPSNIQNVAKIQGVRTENSNPFRYPLCVDSRSQNKGDSSYANPIPNPRIELDIYHVSAARLLLVDSQGRQQTIRSLLKAPQSIVRIAKGTFLLAEGGRNRVLELGPSSVLEVHEEVDELLDQHDAQARAYRITLSVVKPEK